MSQPAAKCVFCGRTGVTKGHVWPKWISKLLPPATHHDHYVGRFFTFTTGTDGPPQSTEKRQGHATSRKPRNTCAKCNNEWMSRIENAAIGPTAPLILNQPFLLDTISQRLLVSFLCLMSMRLEFLGTMRAVPQADREWLMHNFQPTRSWKIWIARYGGENSGQHFSRYCGMQAASSPPEKVGDAYCNTQVTTFVIGQLCAHLYSSTIVALPVYEGIRLTEVWPPRRFDIDTGELPVLSDEAVLWLHEAVARESPSPPVVV
jgi:hypothetical protein